LASNVTGELVASWKPLAALLVAVTLNVAGVVTFGETPLTEHPVSVTANLTASGPDPPDVVSSIAVPTESDVVVLDTGSLVWVQ
jgi:hypothetical protein